MNFGKSKVFINFLSIHKKLSTRFNATKELYHLKYATLKLYNLQNCIDNCSSATSKDKIRTLLINLDKYALAHDIINRSYASLIELPTIACKKNTFYLCRNQYTKE